MEDFFIALRFMTTYLIWDREIRKNRSRIIDVHARLRMLRTINALFLTPEEIQRKAGLERLRSTDLRSKPSWLTQ